MKPFQKGSTPRSGAYSIQSHFNCQQNSKTHKFSRFRFKLSQKIFESKPEYGSRIFCFTPHRFLETSDNDLVSLAQILSHESLNTTARRNQQQLAETAEQGPTRRN